ncbi:hypothetical protein ABZ930_07370 [Streptomyces sp. NPDC046716]|uniref:hypothetical protein n=1 Tax=Streptomyces sp. NPDC046716 TaxID=3157093 RepID=UPI003406B87C
MAWLGVIVLAGVGFWVGRRLHRYPGGWAFAFGLRYESDRDALANARSEVRAQTRKADRDVSLARSAVTAAETSRKRRLRELGQKQTRLRHPGSGERTGSLGALTLFQHRLMVKSDSEISSAELAQMEVHFTTDQTYHYIYCINSGGQSLQAKYRHLPPAPETQEERRFDESTVRDFVRDIEKAVARENSFREQLPHQLAVVESELEEAENDTSAADAARERLEEVRERNRQDPRSKVLEQKLAAALTDWEELTGHVPPR